MAGDDKKDEDGGMGSLFGGLLQEGAGGIKKAVEEGRGWSTEDIMAYAQTIPDNHPMFAETLEEMDPAMVEAIQQIKFEGKDLYQLAEQAKNHGNQLFSFGKKNPHQYHNSIVSYTEAVGYAREAEDSDARRLLLSQIYSNRAFAHLLIKNYKSCKDDCDRALVFSPDNVKACYRKARACQGLKQYDDAVSACDRGLALDPENKEIQEVRRKCTEAMDEARRREVAKQEAKQARINAKRSRLRQVWDLCASRGIKLGEAFYAGSSVNATQAEALPAMDQESGSVVWPVLFLYPEHGMTDFVERFGEDEMLAMQLAEMFPEEGPPAPWDRDAWEYRCSELEVYLQAKSSEAFQSCEEYVDAVERYAVLVGRGEEAGVSRDKAEAELEKRNVWKDNGEVLRYKDHVVSATLPALHVFPRKSKAHADFLKMNKGNIRTLSPDAQTTAREDRQ